MTQESPVPTAQQPSPSAAVQARSALLVFLGGASYGAMATTYKLCYAAGFTSVQVVGAQSWFGLGLMACVFILQVLFCGIRPRRIGIRSTAQLIGLGVLTCTTGALHCHAMNLLPVEASLALLFQFTWIGIVIQMILTHRPPRLSQVAAALVIVCGTVFASGIWHTGLAELSPIGVACSLGAAVSCALFVTLSGVVRVDCPTTQRGVIVSTGTAATSLLVCPDFLVSGIVMQGMAPYGIIMGLFGLVLPVLLFALGTPHLPAGTCTILTSSELPAGLLLAMLVLGTPLSAVEWIGVAAILGGVALAQVPPSTWTHLRRRSRPRP